MKQFLSRLKPFLRWAILGGALFFLARVLRTHWEGVATIRLNGSSWACLTIALGITLSAHITAGWVWSWILRDLHQPIPPIPIIQAYLKTTIAKYLPGNIWHYYGRITAATKAGATPATATLSVLLEPLLMAAAALLLTLLCSQQIAAHYGFWAVGLQGLSLVAVLAVVHPKTLNFLLQRLSRAKQAASPTPSEPARGTPDRLEGYPVVPLLGELGFVLLRGIGFLLTFLAVNPIAPDQILLLLSGFSLAWLLGLVVPGAPGGIGVFEATALVLLGQIFPAGGLLAGVALYRLISVLAEAIGAGVAWLDQQRFTSVE